MVFVPGRGRSISSVPGLYGLPSEWFDGAVLNAGLFERLNSKLCRVALLLFPLLVLLGSFRPVMDNVDLGWHVAQGRWMVQHAAVYQHDVFSYANLGRPVIDEYPLFQLVLYAAWSLGWWGPCLLTAVCYAILAGLLAAAAPRRDPMLLMIYLLALGLAFLCLYVGVLLRPHMATYLGMVMLGLFLHRHRDPPSWIIFWPMALLQVAWTNCHSGFVIGPAMVGLFGAEMTLRRAIRNRAIPWGTAKTWLGAFVLILLACFLNPYGIERFYPVFSQEHLESIRAYVGEMEPVPAKNTDFFTVLTLVVGVLLICRRAQGPAWSFVILAALFYLEALSAKKSWPVYGLFAPLIVLSANGPVPSRLPLDKTIIWIPLLTFNFLLTSIILLAVCMQASLLPTAWRELDHGRSELSIDATAWMKVHAIEGRLFHRCEDGGWLQMSGYDRGETYSDTGFGKYDEAFIHEVGLVNERPALIPRFLSAYHPDFVVCSGFCFQWPFYLRQNGWRLIFYSPNSSVWTRPGVRPDLPTVTNEQIVISFDRDLHAHGMPADIRLFGRNIIALNSFGLDDFAFFKLSGLPPDLHRAAWYWEAARFLCFAEPPCSAAHRDAFEHEAESLPDDAVTAEFRAYYAYYTRGSAHDAREILQLSERDRAGNYLYGNYAAELLLRMDLEEHNSDALNLALQSDYFDLRNGRHWQYLAQAEEQAGRIDAARADWQRAVFYYPDDAALMKAAAAFAVQYKDAALAKAIADSGKVYGSTGL